MGVQLDLLKNLPIDNFWRDEGEEEYFKKKKKILYWGSVAARSPGGASNHLWNWRAVSGAEDNH